MDRRSFLAASAALAAAPGSPAAGPASEELPFRQIHLDFHTSEWIPDVGADFRAEEFLRTLQDARVNSINVFAKCHHGYAYYDTRIAAKHPALKTDLLGEMVRVLKPAGIRVNYYYSLVWDVLQARRHPEWLQRERDGKTIGGPPTDQWPWLCMNTPYLDHVVRENEEILSRYPVDGSWFDILKQPPDGCFCQWCVEDRRKLGLLDTPEDLFRHNKLVARRVEDRLFQLTRKHVPGGAVFFNSRIIIGVRDELDVFSHIEIESLPTGGWGYTHFQQRVRYMRTLGKDVVGMTGRFHKSWGDFGGLKNQAALDYECLNFLANGVKVCVGDQLHPRGRLDPVTYRRIGRTYRKVEALEPWARGVRALTDLGVVSAAATNPERATNKIPTVDQGFTNLLLELHHQFDVLDADSDLSRYPVVIVPDEIRPVERLVRRLRDYVAAGGALLVSDRALLDPQTGQFALDLGVEYQGPGRYAQSYLLLQPEWFPAIDDQPYFLYQRGSAITARPGTETLATYGYPYFDRSPAKFSSHKQTPLGQRSPDPLITRRGKIIYIANPFFTSYALDGYGVQKQVVAALLERLLARPRVRTNLPSTAQIQVLEQPREKRVIAHVLYYPLTRRAPDLDIIEEPGLLTHVEISVRLEARPRAAYAIPSRAKIPFEFTSGYAACRLPRVEGHAAVCFES